jgi:YD repeat-containing protein
MKVVPPVQLPEWTKDPLRNQRMAEELIEVIGDAYPDHAWSKNIFIGVTSDDMYEANSPAEYVLSHRQDDRLAIISTARLSQPDEGSLTSAQVEQRLRKLITNNLGTLYYGLIRRRAPYSVLFGYVHEPADLDKMAEDLTDEDVEINQDLPPSYGGDPCMTVHHHYFSTSIRTDRAYFSPCRSGSRQLDVEAMDVDLRYGIFSTTRTEFSFPDSIPLHFTRVTRNLDPRSRALGVGGSHNLNLFPVGNTFPFTWVNLLLEHGGPIRYRRANIGFGYWDAFYREQDDGDSEFSRSTIAWIWSGWRIRTESGREYLFPPSACGYPEQSALSEIRHNKDRLTLERNGSGHLLVARSPSGKELRFTYDSSNRIERIEAGNGDWREYRYDAHGNLSQVTSPRQTTNYRRDKRSLSILSDGGVLLEGEFDEADRIVGIRLSDGASYRFEYPPDVEKKGGAVTVSDSRGGVLQFDLTTNGYTYKVVK